jgi:hypothetical protein
MPFKFRRSVRPILAAWALLVAVSIGAPVRAAPSEGQRESARRFMTQGTTQYQAGNLAVALAAFRAAHDIMNVPTTGLEVARTLGALGKLMESRKVAAEVQSSPPEAGEPPQFGAAREEAKRMLTELDQRIPKLRVVVSGLPQGTSAALVVDGRDVRADPEGLVAVNPGLRLVNVLATGYAPAESKVEVKERSVVDVPVTLQPIAAQAPAARPTPATPPPSSDPLLLDDCEHDGWAIPARPWGPGRWQVVSAEGSDLIPPGSALSHDQLRMLATDAAHPLMQEPGANGSRRAAHLTGTVRGIPVAWAVLQIMFRPDYATVDLSQYDGVEFDARSDLQSRVKFKAGEVRTFKAAGRCKQCDNYHTVKPIVLGPTWSHYVFRFSDMKQEPGWGDQVGDLDLKEVTHLEWFASSGALDLWVDNVRLIARGKAPGPSTRAGTCAGCRTAGSTESESPGPSLGLLGAAGLLGLRRARRRSAGPG